jgi:hypothetical protein
MAKRKGRQRTAIILFGISAAGAFAMILALSFLPEILAPGDPAPRTVADSRAQIVLISSLVMLSCFAGLVLLASNRKREQMQIWRQVASVFEEPARISQNSPNPLIEGLSQEELQELAVQLYRELGYRLVRGSAGASDPALFLMANPEGENELIGCVQRDRPVGLGEVCDLYAKMDHYEARRCALWAPGGFKQEAASWAQRKPILLAGQREIAGLVEYVMKAIEESNHTRQTLL